MERRKIGFYFVGCFARPVLPKPKALPRYATWREVDAPFDGVGVRILPEKGFRPTVSRAKALVLRLGLHRADAWMFLVYDYCSGLDDFLALGRVGKKEILASTFSRSDLGPDGVWKVYLKTMRRFGVEQRDAWNFPPFTEGWWEDASRGNSVPRGMEE